MDLSKIPSPCHVLDRRALQANLARIDAVQKASGARILLAFKGFAMFAAFDFIRPYVSGASASSLGEALLCKEYLKLPAHSYCPAYLEQDFEQIVSCSSHLTFNSLTQWERYKERTEQTSVGIRINPEHRETETELYDPCAPGSRLGITAEVLGPELPKGIEGLHIHNLCEKGADAFQRTVASLEDKFSKHLRQARWLNCGGGHLMTRADYDTKLLIETILYLKQTYDLEVILEPSAAFVWQAGVLVTTVQDIVESNGIKTAIVDSSITAHMPDCLEMPYRPEIRGASEPLAGEPYYRIGGLTCLAGDFLGDYSFPKPLSVGDKLVFEDMMHYTMVKTTMFNGVNLPSIGIWGDDDEFQLVRRFGYQDYKNRLS